MIVAIIKTLNSFPSNHYTVASVITKPSLTPIMNPIPSGSNPPYLSWRRTIHPFLHMRPFLPQFSNHCLFFQPSAPIHTFSQKNLSLSVTHPVVSHPTGEIFLPLQKNPEKNHWKKRRKKKDKDVQQEPPDWHHSQSWIYIARGSFDLDGYSSGFVYYLSQFGCWVSWEGVGGENLRTSKVDISERMSRTSRAAWRFMFGSVMLDWGIAVALWSWPNSWLWFFKL